jgi:hypothetical protein
MTRKGEEESHMPDNSKKTALPKKAARKPKPPRPPLDEDEEDGDIATPKRDRTGNDDEPL